MVLLYGTVAWWSLLLQWQLQAQLSSRGGSATSFLYFFLKSFSFLVEVIVAFFANPQKVSVLGKMIPLMWRGTWNSVLVYSHSHSNFACIIRAGDRESIIRLSQLCPGVAVHVPSYSLAPVQIESKLPETEFQNWWWHHLPQPCCLRRLVSNSRLDGLSDRCPGAK